MKRVMIIIVCILCPVYLGAMASDDASGNEYSLSSTDADDRDEVVGVIFGAPGKHARSYEISALIDDHLSGNILSPEQRRKIKNHLKSLSDDEYARVICKMGIMRGKKGRKNKKDTPPKIDVATALLAIVDELKEQNRNMASSGALQQKEYEQQVASAEFTQYMWRNRFWGVIGGAVVTNAIQLVINIWQASQNSDDHTNSTTC